MQFWTLIVQFYIEYFLAHFLLFLRATFSLNYLSFRGHKQVADISCCLSFCVREERKVLHLPKCMPAIGIMTMVNQV